MARQDLNKARVIYSPITGRWYIVRGAHNTPLSGAFPTKAAALAWWKARIVPENVESGSEQHLDALSRFFGI
jgi:hypothetical protein